jgi:DNA gyrase subunit A
MTRIVTIPIEDEMKEAYVDYAMSVIVSRALPDVRDGLKPVHRRILYTMYEENLTPDRPFKKSASTVGTVMARYHPHGDAAIYDALVRMAQDFNLRYPLVSGHGNFGSVDGDAPAAMRYTEARLSRLAMEMLADLEKDTVDWRPNFDASLQEPVVLPSKLPNLLINGSDGIAVGMATKIPPHNLGEVVDALHVLLDNPEASNEELMACVQGPDFPTGAAILGTEGIREAYTTGRGSITVRAVIHEEDLRRDRKALVVTEIPYQVNKARLIEKIAELVREKRVEGISDLRDESDRRGLRIVMELSASAQPEVVKNQLYKHSDLQTNFGVIMLALVDGIPRILDLRGMLGEFLRHRREVVVRRSRYDLDKAEKRRHIVEGLLLALDHIDAIIALIRGSRDASEARAGLQEKFALTEVQAQAILDMRLQRLTGLEREKLEAEYAELNATIDSLRSLLESPRLVDNVIRAELAELKERYGDERRTRIVPHRFEDFDIEQLIAEEQMAVTVSHSGYIKRTRFDTYKTQRRGGRGVAGASLKAEDVLAHLFVASTHHNVLFFTNQARVFKLKVHEIPEYTRAARGIPVVNLLRLDEGERLAAIIPVRSFDQGGYIVTCSRKGIVKRTPLEEYANIRAGGIRGLVLQEGDELVNVRLTPGNEELVLATRWGMAIRFNEEEVRVTGRVAQGVKGISLRAGDEVVAMDSAVNGDELLVVTEKGFAKRTPLDQYRFQGRGGVGVKTLQRTEKTGDVVAARVVREDHELLVSTAEGVLIRVLVRDIRQTGRAAQGVILIRLAENDRVVAVARIAPEEEAEGEEPETPSPQALTADPGAPPVGPSGEGPDAPEE